MATTNRGFAVPEGGDDVNIPGDVVNLTNSIIPSMTTTAISALSWADKPAGRQAYDTTQGALVRSTGAAMVRVHDASNCTAGFVAAADFIFAGGWYVSNVAITLPPVPAGATGWAVVATAMGQGESRGSYGCVAEVSALSLTLRITSTSMSLLTGVAWHAIAY